MTGRAASRALAVVALLLLCGACGDAEDAGAPPARPDPVAAAVRAAVRRLAAGDIGREEMLELRQDVVFVLEEEGVGTPADRDREAARMLLDVEDALRRFVPDGAPTPQPAALSRLAQSYADALRGRIAGGTESAVHAGTFLAPIGELELPPGHQRVSWSDLGGFPWDERSPLPASVRGLDGARVGVAGYMISLEGVARLREFLLVESLWSCCFGTPPAVHQVVVVRTASGGGVPWTDAPVLVLGRLSVGPEREDGFVTSVYRMAADEVRVIEERR